MGGGDEVPRDHNAPKKGSGRRLTSRRKGKALSAMIKEREQEDEAHMGLMQLLGALQFNPKPSTPKTSLLAGVQVKEEKRERAEVARTHMDEVTKGKVNSMGKRKQHSKHRKRMGLHPSEASREKENPGTSGDSGAIYTKTLVGRAWKVLEMSREVYTSLHYGGRHERSPGLSREF
ncbi:hypothetical protein CK203_092522 [Vitis vinifera]|uniref:Uncharacterized protein n=1 Tax=Vitis vinifera TaxID=29760 RepID=A0A438DHR5_VITVI|nr:hypothetical protein CK203_092522 [Vitis vinifera]